MLTSLLPLILIVVIVMYFLCCVLSNSGENPTSRWSRALRRGDTVVTNGGLVGKVTKVVDDDQIEVEISDGVRVRQMRSMVPKCAPRASRSRPPQRELIAARRDSASKGYSIDVVFHALESGRPS